MNKDFTKFLGISGIYKLTIDSHTYIGSSSNIYARLHKHKNLLVHNNHHNPYVQNCFNKHNTLHAEVLETCEKESLIEREIWYMEQELPDLNYRHPNESRSGFTMSEESKLKISKANMGRKVSQETRDKISKANTGRTSTDEFKKQCSIRASNMSAATKRKIALNNKARILSEDEVRCIKFLLKTERVVFIAELYNMSISLIYKIKQNKRWMHIQI